VFRCGALHQREALLAQDHGPAAAWTAIAKPERVARAMTCGWAIRIAVGRLQGLAV
jgi:hypothetical protein